MAKKKIFTDEHIITSYMDYVLEHNQQPKTVYAFAKANNFEEQQFYEFFASFQALESDIFKAFFDNTLKLLQESENYESFDSRNKLLSFYFTFFENLTANRSFVLFALNQHENKLKNLKCLTKLRQEFLVYISTLNIEVLETKQQALDKFQEKGLQESAWVQLLVTLKFWMEDSSAAFEKTDIFIEKSINTSFDFLNVAPLKSLLDLGKFLLKEKVQTQ
ncbi:TetR family transcriptional regulator C-terminal domain-containing protein [Formosa sp. PL04]|uniref:TetR family transcriptional regulator C-terminal domain-containing protein n=1 Tax=Formosa sp. PL04 TaxID=3081755 RepID=UPI0029813751|nr:TetR family transcriptional regulator C-terminal domain-containing protein [Formosa sp. PL04]MDW5289132.1 TetR family transcriptional regulator C-terminal domain-containing protein [Formosa sp. PL04]